MKHIFTSPLITPLETKWPAAAGVPLCQLGCHLFAWLHATSSILKAQLQCNKLCCNLSAWPQVVSSAASCQGSRKFSSIADYHLCCNSANQVCLVSSAAHTNSAAHMKPSCNLSALPWNQPGQLYFVSLPAICLLSCIL